MRARHLAAPLAVTALASLTLVTGPATHATPGPHHGDREYTGHHHDRVKHDMAVARKASARFRDPKRAIAEGYVRNSLCTRSMDGDMGYHYIKDEYFGSTDLTKPAMLVYAPDKNGKEQLAAVEWVVLDRDNNVNTDDDRPHVFGRGLDGPMPGHSPTMPVHYDLHAWIWKKNPGGLLAMWNKAVHCPVRPGHQ